jgi:hypothetical protein
MTKCCSRFLQRGLHDPGIAGGPVAAVPRDQPQVRAVALEAPALAVRFDLVDPVGAGQHRLAAASMQNSNAPAAARHWFYLCFLPVGLAIPAGLEPATRGVENFWTLNLINGLAPPYCYGVGEKSKQQSQQTKCP